MRLTIMRHAIAAPHGTPGFASDNDRQLTEEGRLQARQAAAGLKRLKLDVAMVIASPLVRAMQTAQEVAGVLGLRTPIREMAQLTPDADPAATSSALKAFAAHESVLLVGHEPHLSAWIAELVSKNGMSVLMKKASVACVEVERVPPPQGSGLLRWLMTPKHLALIGKS